jgi:RNA polymerase sigma-70 factor (ECF subfamily)
MPEFGLGTTFFDGIAGSDFVAWRRPGSERGRAAASSALSKRSPRLIGSPQTARVPAPPTPHAELDSFLAHVERRALRIAEIATRDRDEALDLVQDAMLHLARRYAQRPPAEWPPLFYRMLENRIHDWRRRRLLRRRLFLDRVPAGDPDAGVDFLDQIADPAQADGVTVVQRREAMQRLEAALRALPRRQREAFELRIWEGLSVEDTATAMACSGGSVKTHLSRALAMLRLQLRGVWP